MKRDHPLHPARPPRSAEAAKADEFVAELIGRMTLDEKVGQLVGIMLPAAADAVDPEVLAAPPGIVAVPPLPLDRVAPAIARLQRELVERTRLGIPALTVALGELTQTTRFPIPLARAASWDRSLVTQIAAASAAEFRAGGVHGQLAPSVAVATAPTGAPVGRAPEIVASLGGDPVLASELVLAHVAGAQGPGHDLIGANHVAATAVRLGAAGPQVTVPPMTSLGERAMRSWVLAPAEAAVRAGVAMVMPSHAGNSGVPAHVDSWLLRTVLRDEYGFPGPVLGAPGAVRALAAHYRVAEDLDAARALAWEAGVDATLMAVDPPGRGGRLAALVGRGTIPGWLVDEAVASVLRVKWRLGLWERPYPPNDPAPHRADHRALADRAVEESLVLLDDPGAALPLDRSSVRELRVWAADEAKGGAPGIGALAVALARDVPATEVRHLAREAFPDGTAPLVVIADQDLTRVARAARVTTSAGHPCVVLLCGEPSGRDLGELVATRAAILLCWRLTTDHASAVSRVLTGAAEPGGRLPVPSAVAIQPPESGAAL